MSLTFSHIDPNIYIECRMLGMRGRLISDDCPQNLEKHVISHEITGSNELPGAEMSPPAVANSLGRFNSLRLRLA